LLDWSTGGVPLFGPPVNEQTAMAVSVVFRCVSLLSGIIAGLPLRVYKDDPNLGRQIVEPDVKDAIHGDGVRYLARLLGQVPYPGRSLTSFSWRELLGVNVYLWGNHYSVKRYNGAGRVAGFEPAMPWDVEVRRTDAGRNIYVVTWPKSTGGSRELVDQDDMIHIAGPGFDGVKGMPRIASFARNAVSLARIMEEQTGRVHENAAKPSGMVTVPPNISPGGMRRMEAQFNDRWAGRLNAGKVMFVDTDTKFTPFQMSPEDLTTLATRRFTVEEICRFFGVPPHLVGESAAATSWGTGIEQLTLGFLKLVMEPDLQRIEHEFNHKLLDGTPYYVQFDRDALLAMDAKTAAEVASAEINSGQLTPNEARRKKFRPSIEGGDELFVNSTMIPISRALNPPAPPPAAPPPKDNPPPPPKEPAK
jgi:HK97 family phage portal protein